MAAVELKRSSSVLLVASCVLFLLAPSCQSQGEGVVWYVDAGSSADQATCGHSPDEPCPSVEVVFAQSTLINASSPADCFRSLGDTDGRDSTTVYVTGTAFVPPVCMENWHNLHISSYPADSMATITTEPFGSASIFSFTNCSNVTLQGLAFNTSSQGRQNLFFQSCNDVFLANCSMPLTATNGYGVEFHACWGDLRVQDCSFFGDPRISGGDNHGIALRFLTGGDSIFSNESYLPMAVEVSGCQFRDLVSYGQPDDSYRTALSSALSLLVQLRARAYDNSVLVQDSVFQNITNSIGHSVTVHFSSASINNSVTFRRCLFTGNRVRYGGGVAAYFSGSPGSMNGSLELVDCNFTQNVADFEGGGVSVVFLQSDIANQVAVRRCRFEGNHALYGAAVFLFNNPSWFSQEGPADAVALPLTPAILEDCLFLRNNASLEEGVVNALRIILALDSV